MESQKSGEPISPHTVVITSTSNFDKPLFGKHSEVTNNPKSSATPYRIALESAMFWSHSTSSKHKLTWRFGLHRQTGLDEGVEYFEEVEHQVEVIQFIRSGKVDVIWNGYNMSHAFNEVSCKGMFEYAWRTGSGERLQVIGYPGHPEGCDILIDGAKFSELPDLDDLRRCRLSSASSARRSDDGESMLSFRSSDAFNKSDRDDLFDVGPSGSGFRLSLAGLRQGKEIEDELCSNMPSTSLDELRDAVVSYLPETEEIVSRAMLNALFDTGRPEPIQERSSASKLHDSFAIECAMLSEVFEWIVLHRCRADSHHLKQSIFQKQVDAAFSNVQRERWTVSEALRALLSVACLLKLKLSVPVESTTLILIDLADTTTRADMIDALTAYGEIENTAVVRGKRFGVCRFCSESSLDQACYAAKEKLLLVAGTRPRTIRISSCNEVKYLAAVNRLDRYALANGDTCLGAPLSFLLSNEDENDLTPNGFDFCGNLTSPRSIVSADSSCIQTYGKELITGNGVGDKIGKDTLGTAMSLDSIATTKTSMDSCSFTSCASFERLP